ncbi:MAG TPA: hypothetical protein VGR91_19805 [Stellaceae bacterium]|nr:hypothetical protein [Stellaceae bacterium]
MTEAELLLIAAFGGIAIGLVLIVGKLARHELRLARLESERELARIRAARPLPSGPFREKRR